MPRPALPNPPKDDASTMFDDRPPGEYRAWALPLFIGVSFLAHCLGFYAFHVVYPTPREIQRPSASLTLVNLPGEVLPGGDPSSVDQDQRLLAGWLRDTDPALLTTWRTHLPDWSRLEHGRYAPLYERWKLRPDDAPPGTPFSRQAEALSRSVRESSPDWRLGKSPEHLELAWLGVTTPEPASQPPPTLPDTSIRLSPLADASPAPEFTPPSPDSLQLPAFRAQGESTASVQNAEFMVGADATGRVLFTMTRHGSNSEELDKAAEAYLRRLRLPGASETQPQPQATTAPVGALNWWRAQFLWGKEVFAP